MLCEQRSSLSEPAWKATVYDRKRVKTMKALAVIGFIALVSGSIMLINGYHSQTHGLWLLGTCIYGAGSAVLGYATKALNKD